MAWKPPVREKAATWLRTSPPGGFRPELFSQSPYQQPGYAHHPSSSARRCLWSVSRECACTRERTPAGAALGIVGEPRLCWQGWVLIGTPSVRRRCHGENSDDRPARIGSCGGNPPPCSPSPSLPSPQGPPHQGLHDFWNNHAPHPQTARVFALHVHFKSLGSLTHRCVELHYRRLHEITSWNSRGTSQVQSIRMRWRRDDFKCLIKCDFREWISSVQ